MNQGRCSNLRWAWSSSSSSSVLCARQKFDIDRCKTKVLCARPVCRIGQVVHGELKPFCIFAFVLLGSCLALLFMSFGACGSFCIKLLVIETRVALASSVEVSMWKFCRLF